MHYLSVTIEREDSSMSQHREKDESDTRLLFGRWVSKAEIRCEAFGTIDETISILGLARRFCLPEINSSIADIQQDLFIVSAELATLPQDRAKLIEKGRTVSDAMVHKLEDLATALKAEGVMPQQFIIPGESSTGAAVLDMARATIRRAEREAVRIKNSEDVSSCLLRYMNRLSTVLFLLARSEEAREK